MGHKINSLLLVAAITGLMACGRDEGDDIEGLECTISVTPTEFQDELDSDKLTFIQPGPATTMTVERQVSGNGLYGDWLNAPADE